MPARITNRPTLSHGLLLVAVLALLSSSFAVSDRLAAADPPRDKQKADASKTSVTTTQANALSVEKAGKNGGETEPSPTPASKAGNENDQTPRRSTLGKIDFQRHIRPIFEARCYDCHSNEEREGGLRLDRKAAAMAGGDSGPVIAPGKSEQSLLYRYVARLDDELSMPPDDDPLTDEQVALIKAWIDQGAVWPDDASAEEASPKSDHWAFQPISRPEPPAVEQAAWVRNPIDAFVLAKLEEVGVMPSPEASRATLIRRLYLDLIGLPPTPEEVEAFELDSRPDAYERLVDELLQSPHYGERWARHWLDVARYSDSDGYEKDLPRPHAWRWREWVINALNRDLPFDQFTIEQLAGDLLPNATIEQKTATGFHRNTLTNREGGIDREEDRVKQTIDRTNTTGTVWLALTIGCCQCHSHKYDPFTNREYYSLYAFFNNADELDLPAPTAQELAAYEKAKAEHEAKQKQLEQALVDYDQHELPKRFSEWEAKTQQAVTPWTLLQPIELRSEKGASLEVLDDGSVLSGGPTSEVDTYTLVFETELPEITAIRLDVLSDERLPNKGPGRANNGNFVLSEASLTVTNLGSSPASEKVKFATATADFSQQDWNIAAATDGKPNTGWAVMPRTGENHTAVFQLEKPIFVNDRARLTLTLSQRHGGKHLLGRFRVLATVVDPPVRYIDDDTALALATPPSERNEEQRQRLAGYFRTLDSGRNELQQALEQHAAKAPKYPDSKVQTLVERSDPRTTHVHIRGDFLRPGVEVQPNTPAALPPLVARGERPDRLDLARWIASPDNPLTARVIVNRVWQRYFGRGIVATEDDFGTQGERPSHPALLDWLASQFIQRGWSLKQLHRLIVTSATYRQSSAARPELREQDPENRLLSHQNRLRVEAEVIRDLALSVSGLLNPSIGGPSIRPPMPEGVADLGYAGSVKWAVSPGREKYRRGLYIFNQRTVPYPTLVTFDAPDSSVVCTRRERSNTPLQSLATLNDTVFFEAAQHLGRRLAGSLADAPLPERLENAFRICLARRPTSGELQRLVALFHRFEQVLEKDVSAAARLASRDEPPANNTEAIASTVNEATWVALGRTLINLDEFITRE